MSTNKFGEIRLICGNHCEFFDRIFEIGQTRAVMDPKAPFRIKVSRDGKKEVDLPLTQKQFDYGFLAPSQINMMFICAEIAMRERAEVPMSGWIRGHK